MPETLYEQLTEAQRRATEATAEVIRLETEIRQATRLKMGDYVKITESVDYEGAYGRIVQLGRPDDFLPYLVEVIPYRRKVRAYSVEPVEKSAVAEYMREVYEQLIR